MNGEQLDRLARLIGDTAETAAGIELKALAGADDGIAVMASGLRATCTACLTLVNDLMQEEMAHGRV